mgnify:CR=1 FL=1
MIDFPALLLALAVFAFAVYATSHTSFGRRPTDPGPFWVQSLLEVPVFILPSVVVTSFEGVRDLWLFSNVEDAAFQATIWAVYYGLVAYFATVLVADRLLCRATPPPAPNPRPAADHARLAGLVLVWQFVFRKVPKSKVFIQRCILCQQDLLILLREEKKCQHLILPRL